ncbi:MAG: hypothetical protein ACI9R3_001441, partial [Verrucomicrobiales bacterium]
ASNADADDTFGEDAAISGERIIIGAFQEESHDPADPFENIGKRTGAAYVFARSGDTWSQEAYLKAVHIDTEDFFGKDVGISGDTIVVSAAGDDSNLTGINGVTGDEANDLHPSSGAVYVFHRSVTGWNPQAYIKGPVNEIVPQGSDYFGSFAEISGNTIVVGAIGEDSASTGIGGDPNDNSASNSGAAYVYGRVANGWALRYTLKPSNTGRFDGFGYVAAVSGRDVVVASWEEDSGVVGDGNDNSMLSAGAVYVFSDSVGALPNAVVNNVGINGSTYTIEFSGDPGVASWRVTASSDLVHFDESPPTTISEPSPGHYRAEIEIPSAPDSYFLKIEH